jgi:hypothetical protein
VADGHMDRRPIAVHPHGVHMSYGVVEERTYGCHFEEFVAQSEVANVACDARW